VTSLTAAARRRLAAGYRRAAAPWGRRALRQAVRAGLSAGLGDALASLFDPRPEADAAQIRIEARRAELASDAAVYAYTAVATPHGPARWAVEVDPESVDRPVTSRWLATSASVPPQWGHFLRRLADAMPRGVVFELGALAGISGAYLAQGRGCDRLLTIEGSPDFARIAAETFSTVGIEAQVLLASFDDGLRSWLDKAPPAIGLAYIDGHHDGAATRAYVRRLRAALLPGALVVLDDITLNAGMWAAWRDFADEPGWRAAIHTGRFGVLQQDSGASRPQRVDLSRFTGRWPVGNRTPSSALPPEATR
jgi:predicted O-methyltransferase YrrM